MHIKTVFIYLKIWRRDKLGIFTHFTFTNLPRSSQSMNSLVYVYSTQIPSWSHSWSHFFVLLPPKKIFCITPWWVFCITPWWIRFWPWNFHQQRQGFHSVREVKEFVKGSGKFREIWYFFEKSQGKVREENFYPCKFLTFKKIISMQKCVQLNCIGQSVVYMMLLFASSIRMI